MIRGAQVSVILQQGSELLVPGHRLHTFLKNRRALSEHGGNLKRRKGVKKDYGPSSTGGCVGNISRVFMLYLLERLKRKKLFQSAQKHPHQGAECVIVGGTERLRENLLKHTEGLTLRKTGQYENKYDLRERHNIHGESLYREPVMR